MISEAILKILNNLIFPETGEVLSDPVVAADGETYEREFIEKWLRDHKDNPISPRAIDPNKAPPLSHLNLYPNLLVRGLIEQYLKLFPALYKEPRVHTSHKYIQELFNYIDKLDNEGLEKFLSRKDHPCPHLLHAQIFIPNSSEMASVASMALALLQEKLSLKSREKTLLFMYQLHQGINLTWEQVNVKIDFEEKIKKMSQLIQAKAAEFDAFIEASKNQKQEKQEELQLDNLDLFSPSSLTLMLNPMIAPEGQTFESGEVEKNGGINLKTRTQIKNGEMIPNRLAYNIITLLIEDTAELFKEFDEDDRKEFLQVAVENNDFRRIKIFINKVKLGLLEIIDNEKQQTVLHVLSSSKINLMPDEKLWLQSKLSNIKVDIADIGGNTPLHLAALQNRGEFIELLMNANANWKLTNKVGATPLEIIGANQHGDSFNGMIDKMKLGYLEIIDEAKQNTVLHFVCSEKCRLNPIKELFAKKLAGLKLDPLDKEGNSPLHLAIHNKKLSFVTALVNAGANVNLPNAAGKLPLQIALEEKNETIIELILTAKNLDLTGKNGEAVLATAASVNNEQVFYQLVLQGANPFIVDEKGLKAIELLSKTTQQQIIEVVNQFKNDLRIAIEKGDINFIIECLSSKPYLLDQPLDDNNNLAVHLAAKSGHWDVFRLLYNSHHITKFNNEGQTPLHLIVKEKWGMEFIKHLIALEQDINIVNANGDSILMVALLSQQMDIVNYLLTYTKIDINLPNIKKETVLHLAIQRDDIELIKTLIFGGANVYYKQDEAGKTLLGEQRENNSKIFGVMDMAVELISQDYMNAVMEDKDPKTKEMERTYSYLLDRGCTYVKRKLNKLLMKSFTEKNNETFKKLLKKFPFMINESISAFNLKPLHFVFDNLEFARFLLEHGADVNAMSKDRSRNGSTPFHDALAAGNIELVKLFMEFSPDLSLVCNNLQQNHITNDYPIHLAVKSKNPYVAFLLLQKKDVGSVDQVNAQNQTALHLAVLNDDLLMVTTVLAYVPNIGLPMNQQGDTALHYTAGKGNLAVFKKLCDYAERSVIYKDVINRANSDGNTPLHLAVAAGHLPTVKFLLEKNVTNSFNKDGQTPFHVALVLPQDKNKQDILALFEQYGASRNAVNAAGDILLHRAIKNGEIKLIENLIQCGADLSIKDATGKNSFLLAVENHLPLEIIRLTLPKVKSLIEQKVTMNVADNCGFTALHFAVYSALKQDKKITTEIIEFLLSKGANPYQKNAFGKSAIDVIEDKEQLSKYAENKKVVRKIFDEFSATLLKMFQLSVSANNPKATLDLIQQYTVIREFFVDAPLKQGLEDLLADNDIRPTLLEIADFFKNITSSSAQDANFFKKNSFSILLGWYKENSAKIYKTIDTSYAERKSLAKQLYCDIIKLSYAVCAVFPQDKIANEVKLIHQKQFKQTYKSSFAVDKDESKKPIPEFKFLQ